MASVAVSGSMKQRCSVGNIVGYQCLILDSLGWMNKALESVRDVEDAGEVHVALLHLTNDLS